MLSHDHDVSRHVMASLTVLSPDGVQQQQQQRMRCSGFTAHHQELVDERTRQR